MKKQIIGKGRFIQLVKKRSWEYAERINCTGAVFIVAVTKERKLLLTEQHRLPVGRRVIELPAGIVGDEKAHRKESFVSAAKRELLEETGYDARRIVSLANGPTSAGFGNEMVALVMAKGLRKESKGGGAGAEQITVHEIPLKKVVSWLRLMQRKGRLVDPKIYAGLYFINRSFKSR